MINELVIKIYQSDQCGYKYGVYDKDSDDAEEIDGGHCTSDLASALEMATDQALAVVMMLRDEDATKDLAIYNALSKEEKEEVDQRIEESKNSDADAKENNEDCWEGTDAQYLSWALEELEENRQLCDSCGFNEVNGFATVCPKCKKDL